jgi:hypothetical protein
MMKTITRGDKEADKDKKKNWQTTNGAFGRAEQLVRLEEDEPHESGWRAMTIATDVSSSSSLSSSSSSSSSSSWTTCGTVATMTAATTTTTMTTIAPMKKRHKNKVCFSSRNGPAECGGR